jgi:hypothetical protein
MKINLVGPTYTEWSRPFDPQRTVNLYPVFDKYGGKEVSALYGTPGLSLFASLGTGPIRGSYKAANGRFFVVSGSVLYEVDGTGASIARGVIDQNIGNISIAENGFQLAICDQESGYIFTYSTDTFAKITDPDFPAAGSITFIDGYFIVNKNNSGQFYISDINDGTSWGALEFATAENSPDNLRRVFRGIGQLWLFGEDSTEIWNNTGDSTFPFEAISGAETETGVLSPFSVVEIKKSLFWVGRDRGGSGTVYMTSGFTPTRISTPPIEQRIIAATKSDEIVAYTYNDQGHEFYVITGGGLDTTLVYDLTTQLWHERAYNNNGVYETQLPITHSYVFDKHIVGDKNNGKLYELSEEFFDDAETPIICERIFTNLSEENKRVRFNRLEVDFEGGVGLQSGQGSSPVCTIEISKDGGQTWGNEYQLSIGAVGKYKTQAVLRRIGIAQELTFRLRISDPVKKAITGAFLS